MRRIICVTLPRWSTERLLRDQQNPRLLRDQRRAHGQNPSAKQADPFATVATLKGAQRLIGLNPAAARAGLSSGMTLAAARALVPELAVADVDPGAEARDLEALARWMMRWTPVVALARPANAGGAALLLDVSGAAHLFGGEAGLLADIGLRLTRLGLSAGLAMASTAGAAWALASHDPRAARPGGLVVPQAETRAAVARLPVEALRIDAGEAHGLRALGLKQISAVAALAPAALARRFGAGLVRALDRALGREDEALAPIMEIVPARVRLRLAEPLLTLEGLEIGLAQAASELCALLEKRCEAARQLCIAFYRVDGVVFTLTAGAAEAHRDPAIWTRLLTHCLARDGERYDLGFGVDLIEAGAPVLEAEKAEAVDLDPVAAAALKSAEAVHRLAERLSARIGAARVTRMMAVDSWVPERTQGLVSPLSPWGEGLGVRGRPTRSPSLPAQRPRQAPLTQPSPQGERAVRPRPPLLFSSPEPVDAIAEVPDGPPRLFRWRRQPFKVTRAEGPERLICDSLEPRDYYRVETDQGRRFWLFRQGLPGDPPLHLPPQEDPPAPPRWYLHAAG